MSPTLSTFLFELVNFLLLGALLGWLLFKPVRETLRVRQAAENERREAIQTQEKALGEARAALEARTAAFEAQSAELRSKRLSAAETEAAAIVAAAREAAASERDRAARMLAHLDRAETERLSAAVAFVSREAVGRLLKTLQQPELDQALGAAACRQLEADPSEGEILVESAAPLDEPARAAISSAAGPRRSVTFRVVPELGGGLRITTPAALIDASASGLAAFAERVLAEKLAQAESPET